MKKSLVTTFLILIIAMPSFAAKQAKATTFDSVMTHYEAIRISLLNDTTKDIELHATEIARLAVDAEKNFAPAQVGIDPSKEEQCLALMPKIRTQASTLAASKDLAGTRDAFFDLSKSLVAFKSMSSSATPPTTYYCSMAKRSWLQKADETGNPYYGQKMAKCGQVVK